MWQGKKWLVKNNIKSSPPVEEYGVKRREVGVNKKTTMPTPSRHHKWCRDHPSEEGN